MHNSDGVTNWLRNKATQIELKIAGEGVTYKFISMEVKPYHQYGHGQNKD